MRGCRAAVVVLASLVPVACAPRVDVTVIGSSRTPAVVEPGTDDPADEPAEAPADEPDPVATVTTSELFVDVDLADVVDTGGDKPARDHDAFLAVAATDVERWWAEQFPEVYGAPFDPLAGGIHAGYPGRTDAVPGCGDDRTVYEDLQLFVAFYCPFGDFIAYDDGDTGESLLTPLADQFGPAVMGVVLAHEYGHAIQERIGADDGRFATIITEQQADCFAGAWTGQAYRGESPMLRLGDADLRAGLLAMLSVRDPVGTDQFVPGGHGSAFDRVGAFQEGFVAGPGRCAELLDAPLELMPNRFLNASDAIFEGNAPYDCTGLDPAEVGQDFIEICTPAPEFLAADIDHFWRTAVPTFTPVTVGTTDDVTSVRCDDRLVLAPQVVICPSDRTLVYDEPAVLDLYDEFGDFTLGYLYGIGWAEFALREVGDPTTGEARVLKRDCLTGAWLRDITPDTFGDTPREGDRDGDGIDDTVTSSPGDLDEAIEMTILVGDEGAAVDVAGSPFEKIAAFRTGVLGGRTACDRIG